MRRVVGKRTQDLGPAEFDDLRAGRPLLVDVGTGDGKHALHVARARPDWLVVGLDATADAMRPTATRAAAKPARGGAPNAVFVWAAVESLPDGLSGADEVHVLMPWGSLLRGLLGEPTVLPALRGLCADGARLHVTLNLHAWRPPVPEVGALSEPTPDSDWAGWAAAGLTVESARYPAAAELAAAGTSWSRRLTASRAVFDVLALDAVAG